MAQQAPIGRNAAWAFVGFAWPTLLMIVAIPVYLDSLGVRGFGLWSIGLALLGAGGALHLGLGEATVKFVAMHWARAEGQDATRVVCVSLLIYACVGAAACALLWLASPRIAASWFALDGADRRTGVSLFRVIATGLPAVISLQTVLGIFDGRQRFSISQSLILLRATFQIGGGIVAVRLGVGIVGLGMVYVASLWAVWLVGLSLGLTQLPRVRLSELRIVATTRKLLSFGVFSSLTSFGHMAVQQLDKVVIGGVLGVAAVSYYAVPQSISFKIAALCHSISRVLLPFFSSRHGGTPGRKLGEPVFSGWRVLIRVALGISTLALASSPWLLRLWAGAEIARESLVVYWILIAVYTLNACVYVIPHNYLSAIGRPDLLARNTLLAGGITLAAQAILAYLFGVRGAAVGALFYPLVQLPLIYVVVVATEEASPVDKLLRGCAYPLLQAGLALAVGLTAGALAASGDRGALAGVAASLVGCGAVLSLAALATLMRQRDASPAGLAALARRLDYGRRRDRR